jgi:uncharacterized sulfatase
MLTGRFPQGNRVLANDDALSPKIPTIGDALRTAGYHTAYIGKWHLHHGSQFVPRVSRPGFDFWHANNVNHNLFELTYWEESEEPVVSCSGWQPTHETDVAIAHLKSRPKNQPFALFLSWVAPHTTHGNGFVPHETFPVDPEFNAMMNAAGYSGSDVQYHAPEQFMALYRNRELPARPNVPDGYGAAAAPGYFAGCTAVDFEFGRILEYLREAGLEDNTLVVYTSDHGEMLGSHGLMQKFTWYEESVAVPFIARWPGRLPANRHTPALLGSPDHLPTLLALLGVDLPEGVEGRDLSACLLDPEVSGPDFAGLCFFAARRRILDTSDSPESLGWRAIHTERELFVAAYDHLGANFRELYYDLSSDPYQLAPQVNANSARQDHLRKRLASWLAERGDGFRLLPQPALL